MTAEQRTAALTATIDNLAWFKIPHTLDQVVGIYAEATAESHGTQARTMTNEEILSSITSRANGGGGKGGHSDPTPMAALWGEPDARDDADGTLGMIDADLARIVEAADELDRTCSPTPLIAVRARASRQERISRAVSALHHVRPHLEPAITAGADEARMEYLIRFDLAESAEGLTLKCEEIWRASRGDTRPVAIQRAITECSCCSAWRKGTIATRAGLCDECANFKSNHSALPIEGIVRRWDYGKGATPALVLEAQAAMKRKSRKAS